MKRLLSILAVVLTFGLSTLATDADAAKRLGGGKSVGTQRQATADKAPASPTATPAAAAAPAAGAAAGAAAAAKPRSWMGPLAGIAAGLGLAALASHLGFGDELASMVMMGLLAAAIMVAVGFFMRKRAAAKQAGMATPNAPTAPNGMQYAHVCPGTASSALGSTAPDAPAYQVLMPASGGSMIGSALNPAAGSSNAASRIPADFDTAGFEHNAKANFIRLQAANDAGNLDDIRQFTTPEMFAELQQGLAERGAAVQKTEVVSINANVVDVEEDADRYLVSVRFTGATRDAADATHVADEAFDEVWHLAKSRQGNSGWVLAGIQQMA